MSDLAGFAPNPVLQAAGLDSTDPRTKSTTQPVTSGSDIVANPTVGASPATGSGPNWNSLKIGQQINGANVLDYNAFVKQYDPNTFINRANTDASNSTNYTASGGHDAESAANSAAIGQDLGHSGRISLYGWTPKFNGFSGVDTYSGNTGTAFDEAGLTAAAKEAGIDISKYQTKVAGGPGSSENDYTITPDSVSTNYRALQNDVNAKSFTAAYNNPNAVFSIESMQPGGANTRDRTQAFYVKRGDRLVPVASQNYTNSTVTGDVWNGIKPLVGIALSAFLGPQMAAAFGGGIGGAAAAGAVSGGLSSAINGQNVLKGALLGGAGGAVGSFAGSTAGSLGASAGVQRAVSGIASNFVSQVGAGHGIDLGSLAISGAAGFGQAAGLDPKIAGLIPGLVNPVLKQLRRP